MVFPPFDWHEANDGEPGQSKKSRVLTNPKLSAHTILFLQSKALALTV